IYLGRRLGVVPDAVPIPTTPMVGLKSHGYFDPTPQGKKFHSNSQFVGNYPCAVFATAASDGRTHPHRIYLDPTATAKADLGTGPNGKPRDPKKSATKVSPTDNTSGCGVVWGHPERAETVIVSEGIETGAAVALALWTWIQSGQCAVVAAISAGGIEAF